MAAAFQKASLERQLGTLSVSTNRIALVLDGLNTQAESRDLLTESMQFIEWVGEQLEIERATQLAMMQRKIGAWRKQWNEIWAESERRSQVQAEARAMSEQLLEWIGS
jgi:hypothetical protein